MTIKIIVEKDGIELRSMVLTSVEVRCLKNDLAGDMGVWGWLRGVINGKINNCIKRLEPIALREVRARGISPTSLSRDDIIDAWTSNVNYQDRETRDAAGD